VRQIITVNAEGKLLRKAFYWKAVDKLSNNEIIHKLEKLGLKISKQKLTEIFKNPFYCGILSHNWLEGKVAEGKHEKLVPKEIFLMVNQNKTRVSTWKHNKDFTKVPLKNFMKCELCGSSYCGYLVKRKNLWYYKCNLTGCKCNISAKHIAGLFTQKLNEYTLPEKYLEPVKHEFLKYCTEISKDSDNTAEILKGRITELNKKIDTINERWALGEISKELYDQYNTKYIAERLEISEKMSDLKGENSNLEKRIEKYLRILLKPAQLWASNGYMGKLELQKLLFPEGIFYNRKNDTFRTPEVNPVAFVLSSFSVSMLGKNEGTFGLDNQKSRFVPGTGLEPVRLLRSQDFRTRYAFQRINFR
jgi:hypothetical protein